MGDGRILYFTGKWEVRQLAQNVSAIKFWRTAIDQFTHGQFREEAGRRGPVPFFESPPR